VYLGASADLRAETAVTGQHHNKAAAAEPDTVVGRGGRVPSTRQVLRVEIGTREDASQKICT
jgi:hypothetical protein